MRKFTFTVIAAGALTVGAMGNAATAAAAPSGGNGMAYDSMSTCMVKYVHGPSGTPTLPTHNDVAYVDIVCSSGSD